MDNFPELKGRRKEEKKRREEEKERKKEKKKKRKRDFSLSEIARREAASKAVTRRPAKVQERGFSPSNYANDDKKKLSENWERGGRARI